MSRKSPYKHIPIEEFVCENETKNDEIFVEAVKNAADATEPIIFYPIKDIRVIKDAIENSKGNFEKEKKKLSLFQQWMLEVKSKHQQGKIEDEQKKEDPMSEDEEDEVQDKIVTRKDFIEQGKKRFKLLYKVCETSTGTIVRSVFEQAGFRFTPKTDWNILWCGKHVKLLPLKKLNFYQRVNHFPRSSEITRKNMLYKNFEKFHENFPEDYVYCPLSFQLPEELDQFKAHLEKLEKENGKKKTWIMKPIQLSRGRGIYLIQKFSEIKEDVINEEAKYVCCEYIDNPMLINGLKFDLRFYVAVTSFNPLRIYVFEDGLTRFASEKYMGTENYENSFVHLTNYSVNKKNKGKYIFNNSSEKDNVGSKWSLRAFKEYLKSIGKNSDKVFKSIYDVVIKSLISIEDQVTTMMRNYVPYRRNCYELFGFDILLDSNLKPWLIEVNLSPSLGARYPIDFKIKSALLEGLFNMLEVRGYSRDNKAYMNREYYHLLRPPMSMMNDKKDLGWEDQLPYKDIPKIKELSVIEKLIIKETIDEDNKKGDWVRVFPSPNMHEYSKYFIRPKRENLLVQKVLFPREDNTKPKKEDYVEL